MNRYQKLRYLVNEYWNLLWIDNLYELYKSKIWNIKSSKEFKEWIIDSLIESFSFGIKWINDWFIEIWKERVRILNSMPKK